MRKAVQIALAATVWLAFGVPLWLHTIEVNRAHLDFAELQRYESMAGNSIVAAIHVSIDDDNSPDVAKASELVVNKKLSELNSSFRFIIHDSCTQNSELCLSAHLHENDILELDTSKRDLEILYTQKTLINGQVPELASMVLLDHIYKHETIPSESIALRTREDVTIQYSPQLHLTFSLFSERGTQLYWDIGAALKNTLGPLLRTLDATVAGLTIDTQTALFAGLDTETEEIKGVRTLDKSQLSKFVDFAKWKVASSLPYPTLNFILYVPETPLEIADMAKDPPQFIVPQWGGVVISKPKEPGHVFSEADLKPILDTFSRHLLLLLGMREAISQSPSSRPSAEIMVAQLSRSWAKRGVRSAASSLGSLRRLAASMPHIAIPQEVATNADIAMREIDAAVEMLAAGNSGAAASHAGKAFESAESSFFDKHMVTQAYFPDEHKMAVYMPLICPLFVVVFSGWARIVTQRKFDKSVLKESFPSENKVPGTGATELKVTE